MLIYKTKEQVNTYEESGTAINLKSNGQSSKYTGMKRFADSIWDIFIN